MRRAGSAGKAMGFRLQLPVWLMTPFSDMVRMKGVTYGNPERADMLVADMLVQDR